MAARLLLSCLFGPALGGVFALVWLALERAWTFKASLAVAIVAIAASLAGIAAVAAVKRLAARAASVRFAAACLVLVSGTTAFASLGLFLWALWTKPLPGDSVTHLAFFVLTQAILALAAFLELAAPLVLLLGLPVILLVAHFLARRPR